MVKKAVEYEQMAYSCSNMMFALNYSEWVQGNFLQNWREFKDSQKGTSMVVKLEDPDFSFVNINGVDAGSFFIVSVTWLATVFCDLLGAFKVDL
ncbi:transmembrane protein, putative [Medicago truncatula]|uniref:Transmembrane protein, putative n=1 Tax=Medicago truncatula TaxID=3880 RepID=G7LD45_MEDTR|nr:transmembrane protein, putative [Medicago truncatula]